LNPLILSDGGFSFGGVFVATAVTSAVACIAMGLYARTWAVGLAPGMGINAFVAYGVCGGMGFSPAEALGAVVVSGVVFLAVSLTPLRKWLINSIPRSLKLGIGAGIGFFLLIIGFALMGITADHPVTLVTLGNLKNPILLLGAAAFLTMVVLEKKGIKGGIIISIIVWSVVAWVLGLAKFNGIVSAPPKMDLLMEFSLRAALSASMVTVVFVLFFIDLFDSAGTLTSIANVTGKINSKGEVEDIDKALIVDSGASVFGGLMGTTTCTTYVESAAGVQQGGRTGMTSIVIGILFLLTLFFAPLATSLPKEIDAAALIYVAVLFIRNITDISWDDISEAAPAVLAMAAMPLTYSISHGIAIAFIAYAAIKICSGDAAKVNPAIWVISVLSLISFAVA
jgi:AGZA family xanthine/uracil permease-like MFS transporter